MWSISDEVKSGVEAFLKLVNEREVAYKDLRFKNLGYSTYTIQEGKKNLKIVQQLEGSGQRMVFAFIDKATGDIYKPASWAAPAKHARGNVLVNQGVEALSGGVGSTPSIRYL